MKRSILRAAAAFAAAALLITACGSGDTDADADDTADTDGGEPAGDEATTLRLGVFPNITHAPGLAGIGHGFLEDALGDNVSLQVHHFNAGGQVIQALFAGELDISFIGPNPAINAHQQSEGEAIRLIAGSTSGGAFLIVRDGIEDVEDLLGTTIATPALGNTQDVAIRAWLAENGYETDHTTDSGDVLIANLENPDILQGFILGELDGAWVPEPWATRLILEGDGNVFLDESDLWPDGQYVTTHVIVSTSFLEENPELISRFLDGHLNALEFVNDEPEEAQTVVIDTIEELTGARLPDEVAEIAWGNLEFTWDPIASSLAKSASDAIDAGLLDPVDLDGIYDLSLLNELLSERDEDEVSGL